MKLPFRQGIVDAQKNGLGQPQFILLSSTPGYLQLSATVTATTINVAHGSSDYLFTFNQNVDPAWGPMVPGVNNYLYWNVDIQTAAVSYGITTLEPIASATAPTTPQVDQHWFDLSTTTMKVWNGAKWQMKIRLFAGMIPNGNLSSNQTTWCYPLYQPWVAAPELTVESNPGYVMTSMFGQPLYVNGTTLEFLTAKTQVRINSTVGTSGVLSQPTNAIFPVKAGENIPSMSLVYFSGENQVGLASGNPAVNPPKIPVGIVQNELAAGEVGILHQNGEISSDSWNWSAHIGRALYCGDFGTIVTSRPSGLLAYRIGFVKNRNTIVFQVDAETLPQLYELSSSDIVINSQHPLDTTFTVNGLGERVWTISIPEATPTEDGYMTQTQASLVESHETRLDQAELDIANRSLLGHTHAISQVVDLQTTLDAKSPIGHLHPEYAPVLHTHPEYAPLVHVHAISDVTNLTSSLNDKIDKVPSAVTGNFASFAAGGGIVDSTVSLASLSTTFAFVNHTHSIAHVTGLQTALDGKAAISHTHALSSLSDVSVTSPNASDVLTWDGLAWTASAPGGASADNNEIVIGTGTGITSSPSLRYFASTNALYVNVPTVQNEDAEVIIRSGDNLNGFGHSELLLSTAFGENASDVYLTAGNAVGTRSGGSVTISSGNSMGGGIAGDVVIGGGSSDFDAGGSITVTGGTGAFGGQVSIRGGNSQDFGQGDYGGGGVDISTGTTTEPTRRSGSVVINTAASTVGAVGDITLQNLDALGQGGAINLYAGNSTAGAGGSITVLAGASNTLDGTTPSPAGNITLQAGAALVAGAAAGTLTLAAGINAVDSTGNGSILLNAGGSTRLAISATGSFSLNGNQGSAGQVLTSGGPGAPAYWAAATSTSGVKPAPMATANSAVTSMTVGSAAHHNTHTRFTASTTVTVTVAADSNWTGSQEYWENDFNPTTPGPMPTGGNLVVSKRGTGNVVFAAAPGVTINTPSTLTIGTQNGKITLIKVGPNEWDIEGNLLAA